MKVSPAPNAEPRLAADERTLRTQCCVAGGGPAGMLTGYLLARAGVDVVVLEKHADFLRDFRGDTIHPSTLTALDELGLLAEFLQRPHAETRELSARFGNVVAPLGDFRHVPGPCKFLAFMPQWEFLNFFAEKGRLLPTFRLEMETEATDLLRDGDRVTGVTATTPGGPLRIDADLVIVADGRQSRLRERAGLRVTNFGAPMDVLWMRLSKKNDDPGQTFGNVGAGGLLVAIDRDTYFQCAFVIRKGGYDEVVAAGLPAFRARVAALAPFLRDRVDELTGWDQIKLLTVTVDRARRWYVPGLLCIGDAAHAMSPIGGVGINLAVQDAIATANALAPRLLRGPVHVQRLDAIQRRRAWPAHMTQSMQLLIQNNFLKRVLATDRVPRPPFVFHVLRAVPWLRRIPAYLVGIGFRPEHVRRSIRQAR